MVTKDNGKRKQPSTNRSIGVRLGERDIELLDAMSEQSGFSRAALLRLVINQGLKVVGESISATGKVPVIEVL